MSRPETLAELVDWAAERHAGRVAMRWPAGADWRERSYAELAEEVHAVARGLVAAGVRPGDRVGLLCETRPEWTVFDLAVARVGAVCVPVYPTNSAEECAWVLSDSGARLLFAETAAHAATIAGVRDRLPELATVVTLEPAGTELTLAELVDRGRAASSPALPEAARVPDDPATIVYTSGTTGPPKGCVLTHRNWRCSLDAIERVTTLGEGDTVYLYLPLAHLFARMVQLTTFELGATLVYFGGDISDVVAELGRVRPTHLPSVPRLFEKAYGLVTGRAAAAGVPIERVRELVRAALGGRVREALTGAAPIAKEILEFFAECGVPIYEAYGMTESTAVISANAPGAVRFGTVGRPLPGIEVRIAEDGEVLARGDNVFAGYHDDPAATREAIVDGWLHTGDLGELDADGYLTITGRKKDIIITAGGKNLTPANLENDLRQSRWIAHAVMLGDRRPFPVALITLDPEEVLPWARERGLPEDLGELAGHPDVRALVQEVLDTANARYAPPERIRDFAVLGTEFSVDGGELTPSLKMRRAVVREKYADVVDALYAAHAGKF
ncbi:long-chain acyl-CoA synthetase [Amycolatopsis arida]|uniref:Acyl-CoA synthetase n=1 Tax=Amycolatopsis arida TaxID=587909 RepID=A0A1I5QY51_9PSEU|nr:AMP-dependent synthetase/ligase [Amycolatopsis arida]TDX99008.1 long-chain acyl-CoA synthetase [Amycolatopsis arida]SFP51198.1 long-chain acyl-CoA synthetase [Amycolatopsis arida]